MALRCIPPQLFPAGISRTRTVSTSWWAALRASKWTITPSARAGRAKKRNVGWHPTSITIRSEQHLLPPLHAGEGAKPLHLAPHFIPPVMPQMRHQVVNRYEHREEVGKNAHRIVLAEHKVRQ